MKSVLKINVCEYVDMGGLTADAPVFVVDAKGFVKNQVVLVENILLSWVPSLGRAPSFSFTDLSTNIWQFA